MRIIAGLLLIAAAVLKAVEFVSEPTAAMVHLFGGRLPIQIVIEFAMGLLMVTGAYWGALRWFVVLLFSGFAAYSLYLAVNGAASCGCFGPVIVSPWWTFAIDLAVVVGLAVSVFRDRRVSTELLYARSIRFLGTKRKMIVAAIPVAVLCTLFLERAIDRRTAVAHDLSATDGLAVLEPDQWIGKQLPIAEFIDADISSGDWTAVLHRHDCPVCQEALPHYEELGSMGQRVALIEVPPYGHSHSLGSACLCCRLKDEREWFVQTPIQIQLRNGVVVSVTSHVH